MANYASLSDEIATDPLGRGYAGMTDAEAADDLNTAYRSRNRAAISGDEAFQATDTTQFAALTDVSRQLWLAFCGRAAIDPFATANVAFVQWLFGAGTQTLINLAAIRAEPISRSEELGLWAVTAADVGRVR